MELGLVKLSKVAGQLNVLPDPLETRANGSTGLAASDFGELSRVAASGVRNSQRIRIMSEITQKMHRATNWTQILGFVSIVVGSASIAFGFLIPLHDSSQLVVQIVAPSLLFYILPGATLLLLAWRMKKLDLWAYRGTGMVCLCFLVKYVAAIVLSNGRILFEDSPFIFEMIVPLLAIYLFVCCLNARSDVQNAPAAPAAAVTMPRNPY